jgi:hypothetical protein
MQAEPELSTLGNTEGCMSRLGSIAENSRGGRGADSKSLPTIISQIVESTLGSEGTTRGWGPVLQRLVELHVL